MTVVRDEALTKTYNRFHDPAETANDIRRLRDLHASMDRMALHAYGWNHLADRVQPISLDAANKDDHKYRDRLF